uniref:ATP synthase subunit a n=1 Tax=Lissoclinum sp. TIC-2013-079 TaxID=2010181 RepID=A0A2D1CAY7_9ASCI|nr:ATP synthase F0 subunit 6 [Lissoclinum sp. TIC-2013-079]
MFTGFQLNFFFFFFFFLIFPIFKNVFFKKNLFFFISFIFNFEILLSLMMFLMIINYFAMLPYSFSFVWSSIGLMLSFFIFFSLLFYLLFNHFSMIVIHFLPTGTPMMLWMLIIIVEVMSLLMRPMALGLRLIINLTAGHIMLHLISESFFFIFFLIMFFLLELGICFIQAYVFTMLSDLFSRGY